MISVDFLFDFGSPNAYLSHKAIPAIEGRTGVSFTYVPILLGGVFKLTGNQSPAVAFAGIKNKLAYEHLEMRRFVKRHGLSHFRMNPHFPVNTLHLMRGAVAAQQAGVFKPYVETTYAALWEEGLKMDEPKVWRAAMQKAGLPAEALIAASQTADVKGELIANTEKAVDRGAFGSPTFFVGDQMFFGKDRLGDVEAEILAPAAAA
jgi:2-hydroxychromene-2-carboxylate isomerase